MNKELRLNIDKETVRGQYTNAAVISHTRNEFFLDFALVQPSGEAMVVSRILTSPQHAKALLRSLAENVRRYEETFGPIPEQVREGDEA